MSAPTVDTATITRRSISARPPSSTLASPAPPNPAASPVSAMLKSALSALKRLLGLSAPTPQLRPTTRQDPAHVAARAAELAANRQLYVYQSPPTIPGVAFVQGPVDRLPAEMPRRMWIVRTAVAGARVVLNFAHTNLSGLWAAIALFARTAFTNASDSAALDHARHHYQAVADSAPATTAVMARFSRANAEGSQFEERNPTLAPHRAMFRILPYPAIANIFLEDDVFARMRVAGFNPMSLMGVRSKDALPFRIVDSDLPHQGDTLTAAARENRLYGIDHSFLSDIEQRPTTKKFAVVAKAIFVVPPGGGLLEPVAIDIGDRVVYRPRPGSELVDTSWSIAKMALTVADIIHHELIAHLGRTHLLVEPFVAATMRQLPSAHPLHVLLRPHFEGTIFINDQASKGLVAPDGDVDRIFAGEIASVMNWCAGRILNNRFNSSMPDKEIPARGLDSPMLYMPYREDALEHFLALKEWVFDFLSHYYTSDEVVRNDAELRNWVDEVVDPMRGRIKEFGDKNDGVVRTVEYLARAVAFVIFSGSVQHAAVNFPQYDYMAYAPAAPAALWSKLPDAGETADLKKWASMLTPIKTAIEQVQILAVIGTVRHTQLGQYRWTEMPEDAAVHASLKSYRGKLDRIDERIARREKAERLPYTFMRPKLIPQSINI